MKYTLLSAIISLWMISGACQTEKNRMNLKPSDIRVSGTIELDDYSLDEKSGEMGTISGTLIDENGEIVPFALISIDSLHIGVVSDIDGKFSLTSIKPGIHDLKVRVFNVNSYVHDLTIKGGDEIELKISVATYGDVELLKPIIYIYPEDTIQVNVELIYDGNLTTTYPKYPAENGWNVKASPDGTLIDDNGKSYYALYWEGVPSSPLMISNGSVVSRENTIDFLEKNLALLGLNSKESNEFILFWLPQLEKNPYNLIHFSSDQYLNQAQLKIHPKPETIIRVAMVFQPLDEEINIVPQNLESLRKVRSGYTVVEWGGQMLPKGHSLKF